MLNISSAVTSLTFSLKYNKSKHIIIERKNGLATPYVIFVRDMVYPERLTISGIIDTNGKG
jgi:hypothetical protein